MCWLLTLLVNNPHLVIYVLGCSVYVLNSGDLCLCRAFSLVIQPGIGWCPLLSTGLIIHKWLYNISLVYCTPFCHPILFQAFAWGWISFLCLVILFMGYKVSFNSLIIHIGWIEVIASFFWDLIVFTPSRGSCPVSANTATIVLGN